MLRRAFILFFTFHLLGSYIVSTFTDEIALEKCFVYSASTPIPGCESGLDSFLLEYLQVLVSNFDRKITEKGDNFSDDFRIRQYKYELAPVMTLQLFALPVLPDLLESAETCFYRFRSAFGHIITLPGYYQFLFRLTPF
jgi:hypothetical protein